MFGNEIKVFFVGELFLLTENKSKSDRQNKKEREKVQDKQREHPLTGKGPMGDQIDES